LQNYWRGLTVAAYDCWWRCQGLHVSKQKELDTEDHMLKLAELEQGRLNQEIERIERQLNELIDRQNGYEVLQLTRLLTHWVTHSPGS